MAITVRPTGAAVGARVSGVELGEIDAETSRRILGALGDHGVLFFRGQDLSPEGHRITIGGCPLAAAA